MAAIIWTTLILGTQDDLAELAAFTNTQYVFRMDSSGRPIDIQCGWRWRRHLQQGHSEWRPITSAWKPGTRRYANDIFGASEIDEMQKLACIALLLTLIFSATAACWSGSVKTNKDPQYIYVSLPPKTASQRFFV